MRDLGVSQNFLAITARQSHSIMSEYSPLFNRIVYVAPRQFTQQEKGSLFKALRVSVDYHMFRKLSHRTWAPFLSAISVQRLTSFSSIRQLKRLVALSRCSTTARAQIGEVILSMRVIGTSRIRCAITAK